jgi:hypothetical protein
MVMKKNNKLILFSILLMVMLIGSVSTAQDRLEIAQTKNKVIARGGYFVPYRSEFKDIYGSQFNGALQYERLVSERIYLGLAAGFVILKKSDFILKYRNISVTPYVNFCFSKYKKASFFACAGIGLNFRRVSGDFYFYDTDGIPLGKENVGQNDFGPSISLGLALEQMISASFFIIPKIDYNYIFDPHPERGDFGNTGGFNFTIGVGMHF